jgi:hypothetical protein
MILFAADAEGLAHRLCELVARTAPSFLLAAANRWRWEWKEQFGTLYPAGVFIMAVYLALLALILAAALVIRRALRSTPIE